MYSEVLARLAGHRDIPLTVPQYAFRTGYSADELLGVLRWVIEKAEEWQEHCFILDGDLYKAYDTIRHQNAIVPSS